MGYNTTLGQRNLLIMMDLDKKTEQMRHVITLKYTKYKSFYYLWIAETGSYNGRGRIRLAWLLVSDPPRNLSSSNWKKPQTEAYMSCRQACIVRVCADDYFVRFGRLVRVAHLPPLLSDAPCIVANPCRSWVAYTPNIHAYLRTYSYMHPVSPTI